MNDLERLAEALRHELPAARFEVVGSTAMSNGSRSRAWLDIQHEGRSIAVEWRPGVGFGVSVLPNQEEEPLGGLFEGPDDVFERWHDARTYVISIIKDDVRKVRKVAAR